MRLHTAILLTLVAGGGVLSGCGDRPATSSNVDKVADDLASPESSKREAAERSLALTDPKVSWRVLIRFFDDPAKSTPDERLAAFRLVVPKTTAELPIPPQMAAAVAVDPDVSVRRASFKADLGFGDPANRTFLERAAETEKDPALKAEIAAALGEKGEWQVQARRWYRDRLAKPQNEQEFVLSARALGNAGNREDVPALLHAFELRDSSLARYEMIIALGRLGGPEATTVIRDQLVSEDPFLRASAAFEEQTLRDPLAVASLGTILAGDAVGDNRVTAARALVAIGGDAAKAAVEASCKTQPTVPTQNACKDATEKLTGKPGWTPPPGGKTKTGKVTNHASVPTL